jgi:hypothetical protein
MPFRTGTTGLTCIKEVFIDHSVGVDIIEPAIEDVKMDAQIKGFGHNEATKLIASQAEKVLLKREIKAIQKSKETNVLAVVHPAREEGLHNDVLRCFAPLPPKMSQFIILNHMCSPSRYVPLFPHCEIIVIFEGMAPE